MKKYIITLVACVFSLGIYAQDNPTSTQTEDKISFLERHNDQLNIYFHIQSSFDMISEKGKATEMAFKARQFRLEIKGNLNEKILIQKLLLNINMKLKML